MFSPPSKSPLTFGYRVRVARKRIDLSQDDLGLALGVSKSSVSAWELDNAGPSFALLPKLREMLKTSLDELICGDVKAAPRAAHYVSEALPPPPYPSAPAVSDPVERELLRRYRALPKAKRSAVLALIQ